MPVNSCPDIAADHFDSICYACYPYYCPDKANRTLVPLKVLKISTDCALIPSSSMAKLPSFRTLCKTLLKFMESQFFVTQILLYSAVFFCSRRTMDESNTLFVISQKADTCFLCTLFLRIEKITFCREITFFAVKKFFSFDSASSFWVWSLGLKCLSWATGASVQ